MSHTQPEPPSGPELVCRVYDLLKDGKTTDALDLIKQKENEAAVLESSWDIVPKLCVFLTADHDFVARVTVVTCEHIFMYLAEINNPKEFLLMLLEQSEFFLDDIKFKILLPPIQKCLLRIPSKKGHAVGMALETLYAHISELPLPDEFELEGKEKLILEADHNVQRIIDVLNFFLDFLKPLVLEISWMNSTTKPRRVKNEKLLKELTSCLLKIMNKPLSYMDLTCINDERQSKTESRICAEKVIDFLQHVQPDFYACTNEILWQNYRINDENLMKQKLRKERELQNVDDLDIDDLQLESVTPFLGISTFSYLVYGELLGSHSVSCVYSRQQVFDFNIKFIITLLNSPKSLTVFKGIALFNTLQKFLADRSLSLHMLERADVTELISALIHVMTTSQVKELCQKSVGLLRCFLNKFTTKGRKRFLLYLFNTATHTGVKGYTLTMLKDEIDTNMRSDQPDMQLQGGELQQLFSHVFSLPDVEKTDLLQERECIMGVLNLLRYLAIRDKPNVNATGIWSIMADVEASYLEPLHRGLDLSRAHYKLEQTKLMEGGNTDNVDFGVTVGDQNMPNMSPEDQLQVIGVALNTFDMMESVLTRVSEVISQQKQKSHIKSCHDAVLDS